MRLKAAFSVAVLAVLGLPAMAQTTQSQSGTSGAAPAPTHPASQTGSSSSSSRDESESTDAVPTVSSASVDFTGNFQRTVTGDGITDRATYSGGLFLNYRYAIRPRSSVEVNGGFTTFTQYYQPNSGFVQSNVWEATAAYVFRPGAAKSGRLKPFLEGGGGILMFSPVPSGTGGGTSRAIQPAILYGAGFDWRKTSTSRVSLRFGYRGLFYREPNFGLISEQTNTWTHMAEPFAGIVLHF
jgi:hypothetical protein